MVAISLGDRTDTGKLNEPFTDLTKRASLIFPCFGLYEFASEVTSLLTKARPSLMECVKSGARLREKVQMTWETTDGTDWNLDRQKDVTDALPSDSRFNELDTNYH